MGRGRGNRGPIVHIDTKTLWLPSTTWSVRRGCWGLRYQLRCSASVPIGGREVTIALVDTMVVVGAALPVTRELLRLPTTRLHY